MVDSIGPVVEGATSTVVKFCRENSFRPLNEAALQIVLQQPGLKREGVNLSCLRSDVALSHVLAAVKNDKELNYLTK